MVWNRLANLTTSITFPDPTPDNRSNITVDFGFYTMTLGNLVWFDANDNGVEDGMEAGLDGVTVYLFPVGGNLADHWQPPPQPTAACTASPACQQVITSFKFRQITLPAC